VAARPRTTDPLRRRRSRRPLAVALAAGLLLAACADDDGEGAGSATTTSTTGATEGTASTTAGGDADAPAGDVIDEERCEANQAAGTITYISSFDFAAAASILDVVVADAEGYFDELCLDVEILPGFAPANGALVAEGRAQMSAAGSFGELVNTNVQGEADLVAVAQYGKTAIEALIVPADSDVVELTDLPGTTVGIKGDLPYSIQTMLGRAGVERGTFDELILDGFDPVAHLELGIDALPVYKSNEPAQLDAAGVEYRVFDPLDDDVPASFAVIFTSRSFLDDHPTAVQDFLRAAFRGFQFAVDDPETAVGYAFERIDAAGNPNFFSTEGEGFRWVTESELVLSTTAEGEGPGLLDLDLLGAEIEALTEVGVFDEVPGWEPMAAPEVADELYDGTELRWPS
jgi:ABC-type nitrate/sulfonate/bicarbonate transport system substrate-binding protein